MLLPEEVAEKLKSYVYVYIDPRNSEPFYIGKGKGSRLFSHLNELIQSKKVRRIQEIRDEGFEPEVKVVRFGLTNSQATLVEAALIDFYGLGKLTNIKSGYHKGTFGLLNSKDVISMFQAEYVEVEEPAILFTINSLYRSGMTELELYETTRGIWKLGKNRGKAKYAFCVTHGIVREVYTIEKWHPAGTLKYQTRPDSESLSKTGRWEFEGRIAFEIRDKYLGKSVGKGSQNPIRYRNITDRVLHENRDNNNQNIILEPHMIKISEKAILITINKLYRLGMSDLELYETTRGIWRVGENRNKAEYAFSLFQGKVLEVYKIDEWYPAGTQEYQTRPDWLEFRKTKRWEFKGKVAEEIRDQYIGKFIGTGGQNPIRYRNI